MRIAIFLLIPALFLLSGCTRQQLYAISQGMQQFGSGMRQSSQQHYQDNRNSLPTTYNTDCYDYGIGGVHCTTTEY